MEKLCGYCRHTRPGWARGCFAPEDDFKKLEKKAQKAILGGDGKAGYCGKYFPEERFVSTRTYDNRG